MSKVSKYKICKRLGSSVFEKCQTQKFMLSQERRERSRRGGKRPGALSDFGKQLLEKQKVRYTYGVAERQLSRYAKESMERARDPEAHFVNRLESRLDNAVYRAGLTATRSAARQMVSHGHITVNGRRVNIPSLAVKEGDVIAVREGSRSKILFADLTERLKEHRGAQWIAFDAGKMSGVVKGAPQAEKTELGFDVETVLEYYSR